VEAPKNITHLMVCKEAFAIHDLASISDIKTKRDLLLCLSQDDWYLYLDEKQLGLIDTEPMTLYNFLLKKLQAG
jgi:hypothetical protein